MFLDDRTQISMKRLASMVSVLALASSLAACSSGSKATRDAGTPGSTPTPTASGVTQMQANAALIGLVDLPTGFGADDYSHEDLPAGCPAVEAATKAEQELAPTWVGSSFSKDDSGYSVDSEVGIYPSARDAMAVFDAYVHAFATCPSWKISEDGATGDISIKVASRPQLGDMAAQLTLSASGGGGTFGGSEYVIVVGNAIAFASESGPTGSSDDPEVKLPTLAAGMATKLATA